MVRKASYQVCEIWKWNLLKERITRYSRGRKPKSRVSRGDRKKLINEESIIPSCAMANGIVFWNDLTRVVSWMASESVKLEGILMTKVYPRTLGMEKCYLKGVLL